MNPDLWLHGDCFGCLGMLPFLSLLYLICTKLINDVHLYMHALFVCLCIRILLIVALFSLFSRP